MKKLFSSVIIGIFISIPLFAYAGWLDVFSTGSKDQNNQQNTQTQDQQSTVGQQAPAPAQPQQLSEAAAMRASIEGDLGKGNEAKAMQDMKTVLGAKKYHEIKEWATLELYNRAQAKGMLSQVVGDLEKSASANPDDVDLKKAIAEGYLRMRDFNHVVNIYEDLVNKNPDDNVLSTRLTDYYVLSKNYSKAVAKLEPIVNANPADDYHSDILLNAYTQARMEDKALALFKKRLAKDPNSPGLTARYAQALQDFGMLDQSIKQWQRAAQLDPSNPFFQKRVSDVKAEMTKK